MALSVAMISNSPLAFRTCLIPISPLARTWREIYVVCLVKKVNDSARFRRVIVNSQGMGTVSDIATDRLTRLDAPRLVRLRMQISGTEYSRWRNQFSTKQIHPVKSS